MFKITMSRTEPSAGEVSTVRAQTVSRANGPMRELSLRGAPNAAFHQAMPAWVVRDAEMRGCSDLPDDATAGGGCGGPDGHGNVRGIWGGQRLADRAGISYRTLQRHLPKLIANGYLVITRLGEPFDEDVSRHAHHYAIPASVGALDGEACSPSTVTQIPVAGETDRRGRQRYTPVRVRAGGQSRLWLERSQAGVAAPPRDAGAAPSAEALSVKDGLLPRRAERRSAGAVSSSGAAAGVAEPGAGNAGRRRPWLSGVREGDLGNLDRLMVHLDRAVAIGVGGFRAGSCNPAERLRIVSMAVHAQRVGSHPARLFASNVSRGGFAPRLWECVTQGDEDEARRRLKRHRGEDREFLGESGPDACGASAGKGRLNGGPHPDVEGLSADGRLALSTLRICVARRIAIPPWRLLERHPHDWTADRFDGAIRELRARELIDAAFETLMMTSTPLAKEAKT